MTDPRQLTKDDLRSMTPEQIVEAMDNDLCNELLGVKPENTALVLKAKHDVLTRADMKALAAIGRNDLISDAYEAGRIATTGDNA